MWKLRMNQSYSRDLTNRKKKKTGWISMVWELITLNYCVQLLIRHLSSSFIFDAWLRLDLAFFDRDGGNNRESCEKPALAAWALLWQWPVAGVWIFWVLGCFSLVCFLSNEVHEPVACIIFSSVLHHFTCLDYQSMWFFIYDFCYWLRSTMLINDVVINEVYLKECKDFRSGKSYFGEMGLHLW